MTKISQTPHLNPERIRFAREVQWFRDRHGWNPGIREMARALSVTPGAAHPMAAHLVRLGILAWEGGKVGLNRGGLVLVKPEEVFPRPTLLFVIGEVQ